MQKLNLLLFGALFLCWTNVSAQSGLWQNILDEEVPSSIQKQRDIKPEYYQTFQLDAEALSQHLAQAPMEFLSTGTRNSQSLSVDIPMPDARMLSFNIQESPVMMPGISARYPNIRSYRGVANDDSGSIIRFVVSPIGFHGAIKSPDGIIYIDPYQKGQQDFYQSYYVLDHLNTQADRLGNFHCGVDENAVSDWVASADSDDDESSVVMNDVVEMRVYRLAMAANGEWTQRQGGTVELALANINAAVARLNLTLENEMAMRLVLIDQEDRIIFTNPSTDPYTNTGSGGALLGQNTGVINNFIGSDNYEFGHIFATCTDVGGIANLGSVCNINKGAGVSCQGGNTSLDYLTMQIAAHEMGHQLGANHTFNNCGGNENYATGYEPGGGSTIMSYSSLCGFNSFVGGSDDYYHVSSLQEMYRFSFDGPGYDCPEKVVLNNHFPELNIPQAGGFYIPIGTPFELTAVGTDIDDDNLTYCWEQYDKALTSSPFGSPQGSAPSFRSYPPNESPTRVFPRLNSLVNNFEESFEVLPNYSRDLTFRCTVRDNNPEGGVAVWEQISFNATEEAGPFVVSYPTNFESLPAGTFMEVTWDVANTDKAPVDCKSVDIMLSLDGGFTYPHLLATAAINDGAHGVFLPDVTSNSARIKVKGHNSVFFDLSNRDFQIYSATTPGYTAQIGPHFQQACEPSAVTLDINTGNVLGYNQPISLELENLPAGTTYEFTQNPVTPGESSTLTFNFIDANLDQAVYFDLLTIIPGEDTVRHNLGVDVVSIDFSDMQLQSPVNGATNVKGIQTFEWSLSLAAERYDIEVSYSPTFDEILYSGFDLNSSGFTTDNIFDKNAVVYWRIRPHNECGPGPWSTPSAFSTETFDCTRVTNLEINQPINKAVGSVTTSNLFISESGSIEDLDVNELDLEYAPIGGLDIRLTSPEGTEVILMSDQCANTGVVRITFDDEAPNEVQCPPNQFAPYRPLEALSAFDGEDISGDWELRVEVLEAGFTVGNLRSWNIESCAAFNPQNPYIITNNLLPVRTNDARVITKEFLEVKDDNNTSTELTYTLVQAPDHGDLTAYGGVLSVGSTFVQDFIYDYAMKYTHNGNDAVEDAFYFTVSDPEGGFIGVTKFSIDIDSNNPTVSTFSPEIDNELSLFPNPTSDVVNVQLTQPLRQEAVLRVFDLSGRQTNQVVLGVGSNGSSLTTNGLSDGIYLVQLYTGDQVISKKLVVAH